MLALGISILGGVMTETGASEPVLNLQRWLVFLGGVGFLGTAGVGLAAAFSGSRTALKVFAGLLVVSVLLGLAVVVGFSTWCTDCGSA